MQPEPSSFDAKVRRPGLAWLAAKKIPPAQKLAPKQTIQPYWRHCLDELHERYDGVCAYLSVFMERCTGGVSVDHFVVKSRKAGLAYEWSNYRLACATMNSRKRDFEDVLDPFSLTPETFHLELVTGRIYPNPALVAHDREAARATIDRLSLDDAGCREMRARRYQEYREHNLTSEYLKKQSPFVLSVVPLDALEVRLQHLAHRQLTGGGEVDQLAARIEEELTRVKAQLPAQ